MGAGEALPAEVLLIDFQKERGHEAAAALWEILLAEGFSIVLQRGHDPEAVAAEVLSTDHQTEYGPEAAAVAQETNR